MGHLECTGVSGVVADARGGSGSGSVDGGGRVSCKTLERYYASLDAYYRAIRTGRSGLSYVGASRIRGVDVGSGVACPRWYGCSCACCQAGSVFVASDGGFSFGRGRGLGVLEDGGDGVRRGMDESGCGKSGYSERALLGSVPLVTGSGFLDSGGRDSVPGCSQLPRSSSGVPEVEKGGVCSGSVTQDCRSGEQCGSRGVTFGDLAGGIPAADGLPRGKHYKRNRAKREAVRRMRGSHRPDGESAEVVGNAAAVSVSGVRQKGFGVHVGQFADLPGDVQRRLKESRARALIAKNEREEREHRGRISDMDSPEAIFMKAMGLMEVAQKAAKSKNDSRVMGWVETVASSHAESLARSAPSSLPSYASVCAKSASTSASSVSVDGTKRQRSVCKVVSTVFDGATPYTLFAGQIAAAKDTVSVALLRADLKKNKMGLSPQDVSRLAVLVNNRMEAVRPHNEFAYDY